MGEAGDEPTGCGAAPCEAGGRACVPAGGRPAQRVACVKFAGGAGVGKAFHSEVGGSSRRQGSKSALIWEAPEYSREVTEGATSIKKTKGEKALRPSPLEGLFLLD